MSIWDFILSLLPMLILAVIIGAGVVYVCRHPEKL